ncbi:MULTISPECIES: pitrilysin family protein [unclassified Meiothermus]|uniref:M16 family metallopeptidase n=1 Tax=unclassified Meiothermus TaxID=370471 RepID=UPI000D7BB96C|nr:MULTISPECIES: pitrilysin family protein [unclassified Meiothermus]PZA08804.1 insulinase family protein [Meiothermus sp. Pnk-1]RYM40573.1 insulinase family protein [Meiothermus sp. PNK-Is4]
MTQTATALEFKEATLSNGLTVIAEVNPEAKSLALGYFVKTGSRDETPQESGISHFLEHMVFKGTARRDALEVNLEFDRMGAQYNAFTSEENTVYYGAVLPEFGGRLLELFTDLMRPALRQEDFDTEKRVILEEIALYADRPNAMLFDYARSRFFRTHPLGNSVLGTPGSITAMTREQMIAYHARRYAPTNMVLAMAGRVDWEAALERVAQLTADWQPYAVHREYPPFEALPGDVRESYPKATQTYIALLAPGFSAQDERRYAAAVLASLLGEEGNSRLYWALTHRGLVESASAGHDDSDRAGLFYIYAQTDPQNEAQVVDVLREELNRLEVHGVSAEEVRRAKNKLATGIVFAGETPMNRLFSLGLSYQYSGVYEPLSEMARKVEAITPGQVNALLEAKPFSRGFLYRMVPQ